MEPYSIGSARRRPPSKQSPAYILRGELRGLAEVFAPEDAEEPILAAATRGAIYEWLAELRAADELTAVGLKPRSTGLLFGPPGCGKTTLAHHLSARLGIPMVSVGSESIFQPYLGQSEGVVDKLFRALEATEVDCLVFIDEIEAIGGKRDQNMRGGADNARTSILGVLLRKIEAFRGLLIGATNRPQDLDPALWRRFHLQVSVDLPGEDERFAILRRYGLPFAFADDDLDLLGDLMTGASPALLRGVMEGLKRALVIGARLGRDLSDPLPVFRSVVAAVSPPPEITDVPLWSGALDGVSALSWPPLRGDA